MKGRITLSDGTILEFNDLNYYEVVQSLTNDQKYQLAEMLRERLGPKEEPPVDAEVYWAWYDDVHKNNVAHGGGGNAETKINKKGGKKYSHKPWAEKSDGERNLIWLRSVGFKKKWDKESGYRYFYKRIEIDPNLIDQMLHEKFKEVIGVMLSVERPEHRT